MLSKIEASAGETVAQSNIETMGLNAVFGKLSDSAEKISTVIGLYQCLHAQANFNWNSLNLTNFRSVYLTRWRMLLAEDRMTSTNDSSAEIAQSLGYESASAFAKVFRKVTGSSPRQHRQRLSNSAVAA
jgi:AraC-like DNA-binding protein